MLDYLKRIIARFRASTPARRPQQFRPRIRMSGSDSPGGDDGLTRVVTYDRRMAAVATHVGLVVASPA
jgi:hypothetical protein